MDRHPLVSIITPTRNQASFIEHTLASVRGQTYTNLEHLVIDGASTDGTLEILAREAAAGALRYSSEPDTGMYAAVNKGLEQATGDILGYLNSDDVYFPWAVEAAVEALAAHPAAAIVFGDGLKVDERTGEQRLRLFPPFDRASLAAHESIMQPAVFWRRSVMDAIGPFDATLRYVADLDYWLRAAGAGLGIVHVDELLAVERIHGDRQSEASREAMAEENRAMRARHRDPDGPADAERIARRRFRWWQRRLWVRFVVASVTGGANGPWPRGRAFGELRIARARILRSQLPGNRQRSLPNAVVSGLADSLLHDRRSGGDAPLGAAAP